MRLPQELLAEALWLEWFIHYGALNNIKIVELLKRYNLRLKRGKTIDDVRLAIGRGFKNTFGNSVLAREQIAEEISKVCIVDRWDFMVAKYKVSHF